MTVDKFQGKRLIAETRLSRYEAKVARALRTALRERETAVLSQFALTAAAIPADPFNADTWPDKLTAALQPVLEDVLTDVRGSLENKLGASSTAFIDTTGQLDRMLGTMEGLGPDTARRLERTLTESINAGKSYSEIRTDIREVFDIAERQAEGIARTETATAVSNFSYESVQALVAAGTPIWHQWLATSDSRTRPDHLEAEKQQPRPLDQPYVVGGVEMMHPHSPGAPAKQVVNCRCTETYSTEPPPAVKG